MNTKRTVFFEPFLTLVAKARTLHEPHTRNLNHNSYTPTTKQTMNPVNQL